MTLRDQRQIEFADMWINSGMKGILDLCPRFGKIYTTINIFEKIKPETVLIAYPDKNIQKSWETDLKTRSYNQSSITYTTHLSLKKHVDKEYTMLIVDEIHLLSDAQMIELSKMIKAHPEMKVLGLTGTLSTWTRKDLWLFTDLQVVGKYTLQQGVDEGVISDYQISVIKINLDNSSKQNFRGKIRTEKQQFDAYSYAINSMERSGRSTMFLRLSRMRIVQRSLAKLNKTKQILQQNQDKRILVFCGITDIADNLGIPSYHSKSSEKEIFQKFASGEGNHLAVVKLGNSGVTYKPLDTIIINYFDSNSENLTQKINRAMSMEYNNPEKRANIYIITSNEEVELNWLRKALEFFDKTKIQTISL